MSALLLAAAAAGIAPLTAHATAPVPCSGLATALSGAADGDVITLSDNHLCSGSFNLPTTIHITLQGADANQGFDNTGNTPRSLTGGSSKGTTIQNLVFQNSASADGGALQLLNDAAPIIVNCRFFNNKANSGDGGAVDIANATGPVTITGNTFGSATDKTKGNTTAASGGGLAVQATDATISNNLFGYNGAIGTGGGLSVTGEGTAGTFTLTGNTFKHNSVVPNSLITLTAAATPNVPLPGNPKGGGAYIGNGSTGDQLVQAHNLFDSNSVTAPSQFSISAQPQVDSTNDIKYGGGGEWILGGDSTSLDDTFSSNSLLPGASIIFSQQGQTPHVTPVTEALGGGLGIEGDPATTGARLEGRNLVSAGNAIQPGGEGGGIYAGISNLCVVSLCPVDLTLRDSTVAGNTVASGGGGSGLGGDSTDSATVINSIVAGDTGGPAEIAGFGTTGLSYTDSCAGTGFTGGPYAGTGNVCTDPKLVNPGPGVADVHETVPSPTIDTGQDALVPTGLTADYEASPRIQGAGVDMGADEFDVAEAQLPGLPKAGSPPSSLAAGVGILALLLMAALVKAVRVVHRRP